MHGCTQIYAHCDTRAHSDSTHLSHIRKSVVFTYDGISASIKQVVLTEWTHMYTLNLCLSLRYEAFFRLQLRRHVGHDHTVSLNTRKLGHAHRMIDTGTQADSTPLSQITNSIVFTYDGILISTRQFVFARNVLLSGSLLIFMPLLAYGYSAYHTLLAVWIAQAGLNLWRCFTALVQVHLVLWPTWQVSVSDPNRWDAPGVINHV